MHPLFTEKRNVGAVTTCHFIENASPEFYSTLIFDLVDTDQKQSQTAKSPCVSFKISLITWSKTTSIFVSIYCVLLQSSKQDGMTIIAYDIPIDPKAEVQQSIFSYCWERIIVTEMDCNMTSMIVEKIVLIPLPYILSQGRLICSSIMLWHAGSKDFLQVYIRESLANIMSLSYSIIGSILNEMFWQSCLFLHATTMVSMIYVTKSLIEQNSNSLSKMSPNFYPVRDNTSLNPSNKKTNSFLNFREFVSVIETLHANHKRVQTLYQSVQWWPLAFQPAHLWKKNFHSEIMKEYSHTASTLSTHSQGFIVSDYLVKLFSTSVMCNSQWQDVLQVM